MAQLMLRSLREDEEEFRRAEAERKQRCREEYDIGWKAERIPRNAGHASKLCGRPIREGMCCVVLDEETSSVSLAPTFEPAASVNLEYLSLALQVRLREGKEPAFSLDPVDQAAGGSAHFKNFQPAWLAGTSVGEVLFQADYHLKELSMGEHGQPVVGMKSCLDFAEQAGESASWNAREEGGGSAVGRRRPGPAGPDGGRGP